MVYFSFLCIKIGGAMQIKFEGQEHQIDANTLINVLIHYQNVINEINAVYGGGSKQIVTKVNAIEKGSFIIDISIKESLKNLFSHDNVGYIASLVTIVGGVFSAYKTLKGKPSKDGDLVINDNREYNKNIIKVYNSKLVREAISKSIETANEDVNVEGLTIDCEQEQKVSFDKEEFAEYIYNDFDEEDVLPTERHEDVEAILTIISLNFESGSQWGFIYNGFKIKMIVKDDALMRKIDEGARFGKGDAIKVKMRIKKVYNPTYKTYENKSYKIVEFIEHIAAPQQMKMYDSGID